MAHRQHQQVPGVVRILRERHERVLVASQDALAVASWPLEQPRRTRTPRSGGSSLFAWMYSIRQGLQSRSTVTPPRSRSASSERVVDLLPPAPPRSRRRRRPAVSAPPRSRTVNVPASRSRSPSTTVYGRLHQLRGADLLADGLLRVVDLDAQPRRAGLRRRARRAVSTLPVGDRQQPELLGREPQRERARVVLGQHARRTARPTRTARGGS